MRYFLFQYSWKGGNGNLWFTMDVFPPCGWLKAQAKEAIPGSVNDSEIIIEGWNEFKSKEDYHSFIGVCEHGNSLDDYCEPCGRIHGES